ncbi:MAG: nucleotidyltransferase family protein [Gammaproteobacteria bacterium]|nr:nucleotidyltransferase family protein [Gammaproteobacteria bacterium]
MTASKQPRELSAIVLAAGGSSRYGHCKQLIEIDGTSLVRLAVAKLSPLFFHDRINVVVGANSEAVTQAVSDLPVNVVHNEYWQTGLASSLKAGINSLEPGCRAVMATLCDQALVTGDHLRQLLDQWLADPSEITASGYAGTIGTPAIIPAEFYPQVLALEGDAGAKSILKSNPDRVRTIAIPEAEFDLDVPADLEKLKKKFGTC